MIRSFRSLRGLNKVLLDQAPNPSFISHTNAMVKKMKIQRGLGILGKKAKVSRKRHGQTDVQKEILFADYFASAT